MKFLNFFCNIYTEIFKLIKFTSVSNTFAESAGSTESGSKFHLNFDKIKK